MNADTYTAKEAMEKLKKSTTTFYREVKYGEIPHIGKRPNMRFPKEAIDALAELETEEEDNKLTFTPSTIADAWTKQEITKQPYSDEDVVPFKILLAWRKRNDQISMNVKEKDKILGWTTFLPLDEEIILALIEDKIREKDIPIQSIRKWTDKNLSVYIPIIEALPTGDELEDKRIGSFLLRRSIKWASKLIIQYDIKNWYGIGTTPEGQLILESLGFEQLNSLENGERKGYMLRSRAKHAKILDVFLEKMEKETNMKIP